jgi:hypothetical protein
MPNRIIRDGWLESEPVNMLDAAAERFFLRLCLRADDFGRYHGNPQILRSTLFPLRDDIRSADIPRWLAACESAGLVRCYESSGKRFVEIHKFDQRTRAKYSKFPPPDGHMTGTCQSYDGHMRTEAKSETNAEAVGEGEHENRGSPPLNQPTSQPFSEKEWLEELAVKFPDADIPSEQARFEAHCSRRNGRPNRAGFVGWLKKASPPMKRGGGANAGKGWQL